LAGYREWQVQYIMLYPSSERGIENMKITYGNIFISTNGTQQNGLTTIDVSAPYNADWNIISTNVSDLKFIGLSKYNTSTTYNIGDYVYYRRSSDDKENIFKCNTANTTGSWSNSKWDVKTYMEYLNDTLIGSALGGSY
jgi:hypothetical protein